MFYFIEKLSSESQTQKQSSILVHMVLLSPSLLEFWFCFQYEVCNKTGEKQKFKRNEFFLIQL